MSNIANRKVTKEEIRNIISELPLLARAVFASRCARRALPIVQRHGDKRDVQTIMQAISAVEQIAEGYYYKENLANLSIAVERIAEEHVSMAYLALEGASVFDDDEERAAKAARSAHYATLCILDGAPEHSYQAYLYAYSSSYEYCRGPEAVNDLKELALSARTEGWKDTSAIPYGYFALRAIFDLYTTLPDESVITIAAAIDGRLIEYFRRHPHRMYDLTPRQFEELIAELFQGFGFDVELTARTRDGGRDIIAISHQIIRVKYLIECKRYAPKNLVGVRPVRELGGVVALEGATKGILATTSGFTSGAKELFEHNVWQWVEGRDFQGLVEWLEAYDKLKKGGLRRV